MNNPLEKIQHFLKDPTLRKKILFTFFIFTIFRIFAFLPVPAVDREALRAIFGQSAFLSLIHI